MKPIYPEILVPLTGEDTNAFAILGRCQRHARRAGLSKQQIELFLDEAVQGNYEALLATVRRWFSTS